jgi:glutamyl-tRNA reductase
MKYNPEETYEKWAERVRMYEQGHAMQRIAKGESTDVVLEEMARRIMEKLIHPIIKHIQEVKVTEFDTGAESYRKNYIEKFGPKADHIVEDKIDKPE